MTKTIQEQFAKRCDELLDVMVEQMQKIDTWDLYLAKGAGDRAIAGDHEERHLLELLQNARDAIYRGREESGGKENSAPGRIFVAVTEHGMAMANTGAPFRLNDEEVLKAVRFLQRSDKMGPGIIGHKGVGLKSILLRAGAFAVRSRINGEVLRATFSRSRTAKHLRESIVSLSDAQARYVRQQLPRLSLFCQPHADSMDGDGLGTDTWLLEALLENTSKREIGLDDNGHLAVLPTYTTVVYLPYRDKRWERLLEETKRELSAEEQAAFEKAKQQSGIASGRANADDIWRELVDLDRRVLALLGEIGELQCARFEDGNVREIYRIEIEEPLSPLNGDQASQPRPLIVRETHWASDDDTEETAECSFTVLSAPTSLGFIAEEPVNAQEPQEPREHIRILLEIPNAERPHLQAEPLFLYYPIETASSGLPFIIHGPFRVNSSRTALVKNQKAHNQAVLDEAVALLKDQLPTLLDESQAIRRWLPWILLPLIDPEADGHRAGSDLQVELCRQVIELLKETASIPTAIGLARPETVHFFPERPDALLLLEEHLQRSQRKADDDLHLLASENRETYQHLYRENGDRFAQAARRIGLGEVSLMSFVNALVTHFGASSPESAILAKANHARSFFLNLCALLQNADRDTAHKAANLLGEHHIPLLPVLGANGKDDEHIRMIQTESRQRGESARMQKASRVVFWQESGRKARVDIPKPPATVPVHFIAPSIIEHDPALAEWTLSEFGDEWLVAGFNGRPDLFRRVAERACNLKDERVLSVLGYLSGLLHSIISQSFSGAEDLKPLPYRAVNISALRQALHIYPKRSTEDRRRTAREQLQRLQKWEHSLVPVQGETQWACASSAVFGPAWGDILSDFLSCVEDEERREEFAPYERWAEAIERLNTFRESIGRQSNDPQYPELEPPDHPRWEAVLREVEQVSNDNPDRTLQFKALFDLLLLFGVRVGPRVGWRWANKGAESFDLEHRSIDLKMSEKIFQGEEVPEAVMPVELAQSNLMTAYRKTITLKPYHTAFSGGHTKHHREKLQQGNKMYSQLAAWIWLPDLVGSEVGALTFGSHLTSVDAFRELLLPLWNDLSASVLKTGWYTEKWQDGRSWEKPIPSLAAFQLARLKLWQARPGSHVDHIAHRRFPASVMVAWEREEAPAARDRARFFPLFDASDDTLAAIAQDLSIKPLNEMTLTGTLLRLHWLLQESRDEDSDAPDMPAHCWPIKAPGDVNRNDWLGVQYQLLERIVTADPKSLWDRRAIATCDLTLRAARVGGQTEIAVPVVSDEGAEAHLAADVVFFKEPPRRWDKLKYEGRWEIQIRSQLRSPLQKWAEHLGIELLENVKPPAFTGKSISTPEANEAIGALQQHVQDRLDLILGILKANQVEGLEQKAETLLTTMGNLQAVDPQSVQSDGGLSGLDEEQRLAFSYPAYKREQDAQRPGTVVLAEGLALLLDQPTAVGDLQHALTAPPQQVRLALNFRGVDVDALLGEVAALAEKHLARLLEHIHQLLHALSVIHGKPAPDREWQTSDLIADDRMKVIGDLKAARGKLAQQALDAIGEIAPRLTEISRAKLLQTALDEHLSPMTRAKSFLGDLREADWAMEERQAFIQAYFEKPLPLEQEDNVKKALNSAVIVALIDQLRTGELDGVEDLMDEMDTRAQRLRDQIVPQATDSSHDFIQHLEKTLKISTPFQSPDLLLIEWGEDDWRQFTQKLRDAGFESLPKIHDDDLRSVMKRCMEQGKLILLQEERDKTMSESQRRIRKLERRLDQRDISFNLDPSALTGNAAPRGGDVTAETNRPGEGGGGLSAGVTSDQAVRGRVAELFVLHTCWQRFLAHTPETRESILDAIMSRREHGSGEGNDRVAWSTKTAWRELLQQLKLHREALISYPGEEAEASQDLARLFRDLIEVANERGPGYDVLDPFGIWGAPSDSALDPRRVEIKAILRDDEKPQAYRILLTTNEFHRARCDPGSYVLRLISVPREPEENLQQVHWICDIPNPVAELELVEQIGRGIRGGVLPLRLQLGG